MLRGAAVEKLAVLSTLSLIFPLVMSEQSNCQLHPLKFVSTGCSERDWNHGCFQMTLIKSQYIL